jgi:flagellar hook assembly protein FlgD
VSSTLPGTITFSPTQTLTYSLTDTRTDTPVNSPTFTLTNSPTFTQTPTLSLTSTVSPTPTVTSSKTPPSPFNATIQVFNAAGEEVAQIGGGAGFMSLPTGLQRAQPNFAPDEGGQGSVLVLGPNTSISWDGRNSAGQLVSSGTYYVMLSIKDSFGKTTTLQTTMTVVRTELRLDVSVYNSAGEVVKKFDLGSSSSAGGNLKLDRNSFCPGASAKLQVSYGDGPADFVQWDGTDNQGHLLSSGTYTVRVSRSGGTGQGSVVMAKQVTLLAAPTPDLFSGAWAGPNPLRSGDGPLQIHLAAPGTPAWIDIYNVSGELVISLNNGGGASTVAWLPARGLSGGIYLLALRAWDKSLRQQRGALKVVLLR